MSKEEKEIRDLIKKGTEINSKKISNFERGFQEGTHSAKQDEINRWNDFKKELRKTDFLFRVDKDTIFTDKYVNAVELMIEERLEELK